MTAEHGRPEATDRQPTNPPNGDFHKGVTEDARRSGATNAPGLDADGLPNDTVAIAADALGARADGTQG
jgi:hypothetical protein